MILQTHPRIALTYGERAPLCTHPLAKRLLELIERKTSNLALAADVTTAEELLLLADAAGPEICVLKTHIDIIANFHFSLIEKLQDLAKRHDFLLFEDRKFADIGNTVKHQYADGIYRIADWAHLINAHILPGPGVIEGLRQVGQPKERGLLLVAEMSSKGTLSKGQYSHDTLQMAQEYTDFVIGFITQTHFSDDPTLVHFTPGVKLSQGEGLGQEGDGGDGLGQQYNTPEHVIGKLGTDVAIVGRGIAQAENPQKVAKEYRRATWDAYLSRVMS